jgi:hypothetical protein
MFVSTPTISKTIPETALVLSQMAPRNNKSRSAATQHSSVHQRTGRSERTTTRPPTSSSMTSRGVRDTSPSTAGGAEALASLSASNTPPPPPEDDEDVPQSLPQVNRANFHTVDVSHVNPNTFRPTHSPEESGESIYLLSLRVGADVNYDQLHRDSIVAWGRFHQATYRDLRREHVQVQKQLDSHLKKERLEGQRQALTSLAQTGMKTILRAATMGNLFRQFVFPSSADLSHVRPADYPTKGLGPNSPLAKAALSALFTGIPGSDAFPLNLEGVASSAKFDPKKHALDSPENRSLLWLDLGIAKHVVSKLNNTRATLKNTLREALSELRIKTFPHPLLSLSFCY